MFSFGAALFGGAVLLSVGSIRAAELATVPAWKAIVATLAFLALAGLAVAIGFELTAFESR